MLVSVRSLGGLTVSVSCKPDDTVQSFKSKLVAAAATQFVSLSHGVQTPTNGASSTAPTRSSAVTPRSGTPELSTTTASMSSNYTN